MAVLDRDTRAALIARVAAGMTTQADADLLDRLLPRDTRTHLTDDRVVEMRAVWTEWRRQGVASRRGAYKGRGYGTLAAAFNVAPATARDIVRGRTRRDAGGPIDE